MTNTFQVTVTLDKSGAIADSRAELKGTTAVMFNGVSILHV